MRPCCLYLDMGCAPLRDWDTTYYCLRVNIISLKMCRNFSCVTLQIYTYIFVLINKIILIKSWKNAVQFSSNQNIRRFEHRCLSFLHSCLDCIDLVLPLLSAMSLASGQDAYIILDIDYGWDHFIPGQSEWAACLILQHSVSLPHST
jgi:hypothetical protein